MVDRNRKGSLRIREDRAVIVDPLPVLVVVVPVEGVVVVPVAEVEVQRRGAGQHPMVREVHHDDPVAAQVVIAAAPVYDLHDSIFLRGCKEHSEIKDFLLRYHAGQVGRLELDRVVVALEDDRLFGVFFQLRKDVRVDTRVFVDRNEDHVAGILKVDVLDVERGEVLHIFLIVAEHADVIGLGVGFARARGHHDRELVLAVLHRRRIVAVVVADRAGALENLHGRVFVGRLRLDFHLVAVLGHHDLIVGGGGPEVGRHLPEPGLGAEADLEIGVHVAVVDVQVFQVGIGGCKEFG